MAGTMAAMRVDRTAASTVVKTVGSMAATMDSWMADLSEKQKAALMVYSTAALRVCYRAV
jgi:hypothetical protein